MKRKPAGQQRAFYRQERYGSPRNLLKNCKHDSSKNIGPRGSPQAKDGLPRSGHMRELRIVTGGVSCVVGFNRATNLSGSNVIKRPTAVLPLVGPQVGCKFSLQPVIDLGQMVHHQNILGRDRAIRLQLETPVTVGVLEAE